MEAKAEIKEDFLSRTTSGLRFTQSQGEDKVGLDALRANRGEMWPETPARLIFLNSVANPDSCMYRRPLRPQF